MNAELHFCIHRDRLIFCFSEKSACCFGKVFTNRPKGRIIRNSGAIYIKRRMILLTKKEYIRRYAFFVLGLFILSLGIALSTRADLGVSPVSSIPYALSFSLPFSMGQITIVIQMIYLIIEFIILRKNFNPINILQIGVVVLFGYFNDFSLMLVSGVSPEHYPVRWIVCIISMFLIALGVNMEVRAGVLMLAIDGLVLAISKTYKIDFGKVKVASDCTQVAIAVVSSLLLTHRIQGVREGTVAAAIFVGMIIKMYNKKLGWFFEKLGLAPVVREKESSEPETSAGEAPLHVITIAREVGSGGFEIGNILGERLHIPVYNKDMLEIAAEEFDLPAEVIEKKEQRMIYNFFRNLADENYAPLTGEESDDSRLKKVQQAVVRKMAAKEPCIIVGRLASYYLQHQPGCFHVFVHGEKSYRIRHFQEESHMEPKAALAELERRDLERKRHYKFYTGMSYGEYQNYNLCIDSSVYGSEQTADIIQDAAERYFRGQKNTA